jgi:hypothetical protein
MHESECGFESTPAWLFIDVNYGGGRNEKVNCSEVPKLIKVNELNFNLLYCQIVVNAHSSTAAHFKGIFLSITLFI